MDRQLWDEVNKIQTDFVYTEICNATSSYPKVWTCRKKDSRNLSFEIIIGEYGISVNGDLGCLSFGVSRNIGFLAGDDIDYYIYSKLESEFRDQQELCEDKLESFIVHKMAEYLDNVLEDYRYNDKIKKMVENELGYSEDQFPEDDDKCEAFDNRVAEIYDNFFGLGNYGKVEHLSLEKIEDIYVQLELNDEYEHTGWEIHEELRNVTELQEIYDTISRIDGMEYDYDWGFSKPKSSIMFRLYMVCCAARKICSQLDYKDKFIMEEMCL